MSTELQYSVGCTDRDHADQMGWLRFPRGQSLYHRTWDLVVTDLAADYRSNHDGWEASWPLEFRLYEDGKELARFTVECEFEPVFHAYELELPADDLRALQHQEAGDV